MTTEDFKNIFYSHYSLSIDWEELGDINWMYEENMFEKEKIFVASNKVWQSTISKIEKSRYKLAVESGDGISHQALKFLATQFLNSHFSIKEDEIVSELSFVGLEVDVIDKKCTIPVECGDTNAVKFQRYFLADQVKHFIVIPYPNLGDVFAYIFTPLPDLRKYLLFKQGYSVKKLRDIRNEK